MTPLAQSKASCQVLHLCKTECITESSQSRTKYLHSQIIVFTSEVAHSQRAWGLVVLLGIVGVKYSLRYVICASHH